jgi:hypothetical protein
VPGLTSLLILIHVQVPSLAPVRQIEATPQAEAKGRGRERRRGRLRKEASKQEKPHSKNHTFD